MRNLRLTAEGRAMLASIWTPACERLAKTDRCAVVFRAGRTNILAKLVKIGNLIADETGRRNGTSVSSEDCYRGMYASSLIDILKPGGCPLCPARSEVTASKPLVSAAATGGELLTA